MNHTSAVHQFHIPVLGLCYTVDTALKVARYGISSVLSIVEDELIEDMREYHSRQNGIAYIPITTSDPDYRAKRITAYLNLLHDLVGGQSAEIKTGSFQPGSDLANYFEWQPEGSVQKKQYSTMMSMQEGAGKRALQEELLQSMVVGDIDVNIMAKLDNPHYNEAGERMPDEHCDAVAALRGFAKSNLSSSVVISAGYNPRLFNYAEQFDDFYPDEDGRLKKKITIKVSDYRSALVQGRLLAKKGLWVSEFRIESGLNCGGHAFPTDGMLMGSILEEFRNSRQSLAEELLSVCNEALATKGRVKFVEPPIQKISAQGGVGTAEEMELLLHYFQLDSIGWGSPFLLVPEVTNVDETTLNQLATAKPGDFFMSNASPLGVPFQNFRKSSSEVQRKERIAKGRAGSPCYKKYLTSDTEFTSRPICTASRQYQQLKEEQILNNSAGSEATAQVELLKEKDCLCEGLTSSVRLKNKMKLTHQLSAVTICPGPNLAWFSGTFSLKEMVDHIYGRTDIKNELYRPHMFVNELELYIQYLKKQVSEAAGSLSEKQAKYFRKFKANLLNGIAFYKGLLSPGTDATRTLEALSRYEAELVASAF